jgi:acyl carrier protein
MSLQETVKKIVLGELPADLQRTSLTADEDLLAQGLIDSLGLMRLVTAIETEFGVHIADDDLVPENFQTLAAITQLIERKKQS